MVQLQQSSSLSLLMIALVIFPPVSQGKLKKKKKRKVVSNCEQRYLKVDNANLKELPKFSGFIRGPAWKIFSSEDRLNFNSVSVTEEELLSCIWSLSTPLSYLFGVLRGKSYSSLPAASLCQVSQYQAGQQHCLAAHLICNHMRKWLLTADLAAEHSNSKAQGSNWSSWDLPFPFW